MESKRFDYVRFDEEALESMMDAKTLHCELEAMINRIGSKQKQVSKETIRAKSLALTKLEETYMWVGKALRDDQIARNGSAPLQEERGEE